MLYAVSECVYYAYESIDLLDREFLASFAFIGNGVFSRFFFFCFFLFYVSLLSRTEWNHSTNVSRTHTHTQFAYIDIKPIHTHRHRDEFDVDLRQLFLFLLDSVLLTTDQNPIRTIRTLLECKWFLCSNVYPSISISCSFSLSIHLHPVFLVLAIWSPVGPQNYFALIIVELAKTIGYQWMVWVYA